MMNLLKLFPIVVIASNCTLLDGKCIYEVRSVQASGRVEENGTELAAAQVSESERREAEPEQAMYWLVTGATLKGHVTSLTLRDSSDPNRVLLVLTLDLSPIDQQRISEGTVSTRTGANLDGIFELLSANSGVIQLDTDLSTRPTVTVPLTVTQRENWNRPYCSGRQWRPQGD